MKFENVSTYNIENAIRGMRNPLNSWDKSDSELGCYYPSVDHFQFVPCTACDKIYDGHYPCDQTKLFHMGEKDLELAKKLAKAGTSDRKFLRQIFVSMDITAPLYWWKEMDTYKIGTTSNSTSTMHKLASTPITLECFETDDYDPKFIIDAGVDDRGDTNYNYETTIDEFVEDSGISFYYEPTLISFLEHLRKKYLETKDKRYWKELIRWLPESWLQTRTWTANYEVLRNIYHQRKNHKLTEWHTFCKQIETLPYAEELIIGE